MSKTNIITKENLIKDIAKHSNHTISDTRDFYNTLENIIFDTLSSVNQDTDVSMRLFEGIVLDGKFVPEKIKKNNLTGETNLVHSKIKPKFNISRTYCDKINGN